MLIPSWFRFNRFLREFIRFAKAFIVTVVQKDDEMPKMLTEEGDTFEATLYSSIWSEYNLSPRIW